MVCFHSFPCVRVAMSTTLQVRGGACCTNIDLVGIVHALWLRNQSIATRWWLSILIRTELDPISPGRAKTWPIGDVQGLPANYTSGATSVDQDFCCRPPYCGSFRRGCTSTCTTAVSTSQSMRHAGSGVHSGWSRSGSINHGISQPS